ncbi:MAG TPA: histidine phosphatase family protein [Cytophagaceae bacterium]
MGSKKIYLIRHGQTEYNRIGIVQGSGVDTDLNETGRLQAEAFYQAYRHVEFKKIYTSALKRSIQSVEKFIASGIPHEKYAGLNEISWGKKDGQIITSDDDTFYKRIVASWRNGQVDQCIEGGESPLDVQKRQKPVLELILSREEEDCILICMHGRAMRILLASMMGCELSRMDEFAHNNLGLYVVDYKDNVFSLEKRNDLNHLGETLKT